ncbi:MULTISPECIES: matrixin family metalloprotease [Bacillus]|uniref:matrixin family metalloprotease n=1 Tax=Bacillus TaxID=1386 RepID=UPI0002E19071|nr:MULTISPECIES: matrixin family metalloprotease [Bacillus]KAF6688698.1 matrixin family metalloprotease [Bacillus sp. EKM501B]MDA2379395.1 matrixin family metalloprotease [Bacillus cereus]MEB9547466.1 matrixin family metalloprotease [Bacillus cereus]MEB9834218.1 matrixin family metalloprotease [Bacillus cereus]PER84409.1 hypothetical protein CN487_03325 [Bacillus cereus]
MFEKWKKKTLSTIVVLGGVSTLFVSTPSSHADYWGYKMDGGVANKSYWVSELSQPQASYIHQAMSDWVHTGHILATPIDFKNTTNKSSSSMDFHTQSQYIDGDETIAEAYMYKNGGEVLPWKTNWSWTAVKINDLRFNELSEFHRKGVMAHEIGHCFGLAHDGQPNRQSIMRQGPSNRDVNRATYDNLIEINTLYR